METRVVAAQEQRIKIRLNQILRGWFFGIAGLTIASFCLNLYRLQRQNSLADPLAGKVLTRLASLFDVSMENNIPTWYQAIALFLCALTLAAIAVVKHQENSRWSRGWRGLSWIFLFLSLDEVASLHELLVVPSRLLLQNPTGVLYYGWIVPASAIVLILGTKYFQFWCALPAQTKRLLGLAAGIYLGGAIGMEMIGGYFDHALGSINSIPYLIATTVEEFMEMLGILILLYTLLSYIATQIKSIGLMVEKIHQ